MQGALAARRNAPYVSKTSGGLRIANPPYNTGFSISPVRRRVAQAGQGQSDEYVRARDGAAGRASL